MKGTDMLDTIAHPETSLELMLDLQPEEALEWKAQVNQRYTDWQDVESATHLVALIRGTCRDGDWLVVQTKGSVGLGTAADEAGNRPFRGVSPSQNLTLAGTSEVMVSWLNGHGLPLGYGAALHVYQ
jgi:hypothetical protein